MKKAYVLLALFGVWCLASALWYMFSVKGINASAINPQDSALAIVEILLMTLVSVFIGFGLAWYMREDQISAKQSRLQVLLSDRNNMIQELQAYRERAKKAEHTLARARETFREDFFSAAREKERLSEELEKEKQELERIQNELFATQTALQNLQQINIKLEQNLNKEQVSKHELELNLKEALLQKQQKEHNQSDFISERILAAAKIEKEDIDNLTEIKGIGPVIEKKLNMLGIVNFKQLSELTDDAITQISHTLKFFPERIKRDQWVKQAASLYNSKVQRA